MSTKQPVNMTMDPKLLRASKIFCLLADKDLSGLVSELLTEHLARSGFSVEALINPPAFTKAASK